ncbi:hypothetical protein [Solimonas sp. SE-A11]|uniref:hypothetical protein n=1 Tax=Solimonas sp. SE-A11 TaxID=3054954 RepID=UPI00259CBEF7|nr:hypothetical protein [Solimonas sp. SE-A11]MDM4768639.1 hypothetical protein [Solimonas sp. SE-A11]
MPDAILKAKLIDSEFVTAQLPIKAREPSRSNNGRLRHRWDISGADSGFLEIIGNRIDDADVVAWQCSMYEKSGAFLWPTPGSVCFDFSERVFGKFFDRPADMHRYLLHKAQLGNRTVVAEFGSLSFETDGSFYFIRRLGR